MPLSGDTARAVAQENVEIVKAVFAAWKERDREAALALIDPDVEIDVLGWVALMGEPGRGLDALQRNVRSWLDAWQSLEFFPEHFIDAGEHVLVWLTLTAEGRGSGAPTRMRSAAVYTVREGRVVAIRGFETLAEAATAAGI